MKIKWMAIAATLIALTGCEIDPEMNTELESEPTFTEESVIEPTSWGSLSALDDEAYTIEEMLVYALQDEYSARSEYITIMDTYDVTKPFSNIKASEDNHIALLLPLFETYGLEVIEDESLDHLHEIESLEEAYEIGVVAEINNIAMYNAFLTQELPDDLINAFTKLRDASENHLAAFEKHAS